MNNLLVWFASDGWARLVLVLCHSLWQGGLIALVLWGLLRRLPARRATARYAASLAALAALVFCVLVTASILDARDQATAKTPARTAQPAGGSLRAESGRADATPAMVQTTLPKPAQNDGDGRAGLRETSQDTPHAAPISWMPWAALFWLVGCGLMSVRFIMQWVDLRRVTARCLPVTDTVIQEILSRLQGLMGMKRAVRVLSGDPIAGPCVYGLIRPKLLLPPALLLGVPVEQLEAILAHELAHIRQHDCLASLAQQIVETALFFNPAVWWISRHIRIERESCCDHLAVQLTGRRDAYAWSLEAWAARQASPAPAPAFSAERHPAGPLERLKRLLLSGYQPPVRLPWPSLCGATLLSGVLIFGLFQGTQIAVGLAAELLTPAQRIEKMAEIKEKYDHTPGMQKLAASSGQVRLAGIVEDEAGQPIESPVAITIYSASDAKLSLVKMGADHGAFQTNINSGEIILRVVAPGYAGAKLGPFEGAAGGGIEGLKVVLSRGHSAQVQVVDAAGKPVPEAEISCRYLDWYLDYYREKKFTGADGMATFEHLSTHAVHLVLNARGYEQEERQLPLLAPGTPLVWRLTPAQPALGMVTDARTGQPVAGAQVRLWLCAGAFARGLSVVGDIDREKLPVLAVTDPQGQFQVDTLNRDSVYALIVDTADYAPLILPNVIVGRAIQAKLEPQVHVRGQLAGDWGNATNVILHWSIPTPIRDDAGYEFMRSAPIRLREGIGSFEFTNIFPGPIELMVGQTSQKLVAIHSVDGVVVHCRPASAAEREAWGALPQRDVVLKVKVPPGHPPAAGPFKYLHWLDANGRSYRSNAVLVNGEARLRIPVPGSLELRSGDVPGYWFEAVNSRIPAAAAPLELEIAALPSGAIYGRVLESDASESGGIRVSVEQAAKSPLRQNGRFLGVQVINHPPEDRDFTRFSAQPLPLGGSYVIIAQKDYAYAVSPPMALTEADPVREITLQLDRGVAVSGQVLDEQGQPVPLVNLSLSVTLRLITNDWILSEASRMKTDHAGRFRFERVNPEVPGAYQIDLVAGPGYQRQQVKLDFKALPLTVRLRKGLVVEGTVLDDATGEPIPLAEIEAWGMPDGEDSPTGRLIARSDAHGRFKFSDMEKGKYRVEIPGARTPDTWVRGGQAAPVTLRVTPRGGAR